jgi:hypothetical protein
MRALPATHSELQSKLAQSSSFGKQIGAENKGHSVQRVHPELTIDAVRHMVKESRGHETIPHQHGIGFTLGREWLPGPTRVTSLRPKPSRPVYLSEFTMTDRNTE